MVVGAVASFSPSSAIVAGRSTVQGLQFGYWRSAFVDADGDGDSAVPGSIGRSCYHKSHMQGSKIRTPLRMSQLQHRPCWRSGKTRRSVVARSVSKDGQCSQIFRAGVTCKVQCIDSSFYGHCVCRTPSSYRRNFQNQHKGMDGARSFLLVCSTPAPSVIMTKHKALHQSRRSAPVRCSSSPQLAVTEDNCETIEPGLLARVSKIYRPAVILPGLGNNSGDYDVLVQSFEALEIPSTVVKVARIDWLRNAAGLLDLNYWKGTLQPRPVLNWYLERVKTAIETAKQSAKGDGKVSLIGHSAGGWLARVYMKEFGTQDVALLITLGTPHLPPPRGVRGVFDQTRGLLYHLEENYPGAYHAPGVKYVCVAGRYMRGGGRLAEEQSTPVVATGAGTLDLENVASTAGSTGESLVQNLTSAQDGNQAEKVVDAAVVTAAKTEAPTKTNRPSFRERIVGAGYKQVCGKADVWGDGVVPEESAYLEGAVNISISGAYHSPVGASDKERPWYGSAGVIDQWIQHLLE